MSPSSRALPGSASSRSRSAAGTSSAGSSSTGVPRKPRQSVTAGELRRPTSRDRRGSGSRERATGAAPQLAQLGRAAPDPALAGMRGLAGEQRATSASAQHRPDLRRDLAFERLHHGLQLEAEVAEPPAQHEALMLARSRTSISAGALPGVAPDQIVRRAWCPRSRRAAPRTGRRRSGGSRPPRPSSPPPSCARPAPPARRRCARRSPGRTA